MEREARQLLKRFEPEFCFPFFSGDEPFGLLLIGEKSSGTPYTKRSLAAHAPRQESQPHPQSNPPQEAGPAHLAARAELAEGESPNARTAIHSRCRRSRSLAQGRPRPRRAPRLLRYSHAQPANRRAASTVPPASEGNPRRQPRGHLPAPCRRLAVAAQPTHVARRRLPIAGTARRLCTGNLPTALRSFCALDQNRHWRAPPVPRPHSPARHRRSRRRPRHRPRVRVARCAGRHPYLRPRVAARYRAFRRTAHRRTLCQRGTLPCLSPAGGTRPRHPQHMAARRARRPARHDDRHARPAWQRRRRCRS